MQQPKTAFQVARDNSEFLLSLADAIGGLPLKERQFLRGQILKHNENNISVMKQAIKQAGRIFKCKG